MTLICRRRTLFSCLCALNDGLDVVLLLAPHLVVAPPKRPLILAVEAQVSTSFAFLPSLVTLFTS